jgi:hypothetical protein
MRQIDSDAALRKFHNRAQDIIKHLLNNGQNVGQADFDPIKANVAMVIKKEKLADDKKLAELLQKAAEEQALLQEKVEKPQPLVQNPKGNRGKQFGLQH